MSFFNKYLVKITICIIITGIVIVNFSNHRWIKDKSVIQWDIISYYAYLPATFIYKDLSLEFRSENIEKFGDLVWPVKTPTGKNGIITSMGMSILYSPFFFISHAVAKISRQYEADGYSMPYRFALVFSALVYFAIGLFFLDKIICRFFSRFVSFVTIIAVGVGTNLFYYATYGAPMPHAYNFALITVFIYLVIKWYEHLNIKYTILIGLLGGLIALIRPTNILVLLILIFWDVKSFNDLKNRILLFIRNYHLILIMIICFVIVWIPQFAYWKYISGKVFYFSYGEKGDRFFFNNPQIVNILISYKKGWLVYTPLMFFALIGIGFLYKRLRGLFVPVLIFTIVNIYVLSSWWSWWYGGAFGNRAFIDSYGIMALPLAAFFNCMWGKKIIKYIALTVFGVLTWYNTFQIRQFNHQAIHYWWMSKEAYWETFLKLRPTERYWDLIPTPDYKKARQGIYVALPKKEKKKNDNKITVSGDEIIKAIKSDLYNNKDTITELTRRANEKSISLDSLIGKTALDIYNNQDIEKYKRELTIYKIVERLKSTESMLNFLQEKADKRNISLDSMIMLDAIWVYDNTYRNSE